MKKIILTLLILVSMIFSAQARNLESLMIVATDGQFLGTFENKFSSDSIYNTFGDYGSKFSSTSIFNQFGDYGSDFSTLSPFNSFSVEGPWIVDEMGNKYGRLSINKFAYGVTQETLKLALELKAIRDSK